MRRRQRLPPAGGDGQTPVLMFVIGLLLLFLLAYEGEQAEQALGERREQLGQTSE